MSMRLNRVIVTLNDSTFIESENQSTLEQWNKDLTDIFTQVVGNLSNVHFLIFIVSLKNRMITVWKFTKKILIIVWKFINDNDNDKDND